MRRVFYTAATFAGCTSVAYCAPRFSFSTRATPPATELIPNNDISIVNEIYSMESPTFVEALANKDTTVVTIYQLTTCPFCNRVKAFLNANGIKYKIVEVDPLTMAELKDKKYQLVPQLDVVIGGKEPGSVQKVFNLLDSYEIGAILGPLYGHSLVEGDVEKWRRWSGEVLARFLAINVGVNIVDSSKFILGHQTLSLGRKLKYVGAGGIMFIMAHKVVAPKLQKLGYETKDPLKGMEDELQKWSTRVGENGFHGGVNPSLADMDVYGILQCVRGHKLYSKIMSDLPALAAWSERMDAVVKDKVKDD
eukprot:PhM_4_TR13506/c0_g2_i1/m.24363/K05309/PTGES2; microsomal prostaglandin-E synthase 2